MDINVYLEEAAQVSIAFVIGAIIGIEREYKSRPAGLRTLVLICLGSTIFTSFTEILAMGHAGSDNTRILSQVIQGIGFLGAGVIFRGNDKVYGLTSASVIWVVASIGAVVGLGFYPLALVVSVLVLIVLTVFNFIEDKITKFKK